MPKSYTPNWFFTALLDNHINQLVARYSRLRALRMDFFYRKDTPDFLQPDHRWLELNRPGFPGECFICELRLPDHRFRWKHNKLFLLLPVG
ncbi:hypothetical protein EYX86_18550, partial [Escherichia coli]